jgi:hypothetical protein
MIPVGGGQDVHDWLGDKCYNACPSCF